MTIDAKHNIGDIINLFGYDDWKSVITAIAVRASGQIEYQVEWNDGAEDKCEWFEETRLDLLSKIGARK